MDIPLNEAIQVLREWQQEKRRLQFDTFNSPDASEFSCSGFGFIEELTPNFVRIDNRNVDGIASGHLYGCVISLEAADLFSLWDWRNVSPEEQATKDALQQAYDIALTVRFVSGASCELHAVKSGIELASLGDG